MADLALPQTIDTNTTADAVEVQDNFDSIQSYINNEVIRRDGAIAMQAPLELAGDPTSDDEAANKGYVDAVIPVGTILPFAGASNPGPDWHLCNGAELPSATYPALSDLIGSTYGSASTGQFKLPDLRGRIPIGVAADGGTGGRFELGRTSGSWTVPLRSHIHDIDHNHAVVDSGNASVGHQHDHTHIHTLGGHVHGLDDATVTIASGGAHTTAVRTRTGAVPSAGALEFVVEGSDANFNGTGIVDAGGTAEPAHTHTATVGGLTDPSTGNTGQASVALTDPSGQAHTHAVNLPDFEGSSGATEHEVTYDTTQDDDLKSTTELIPPHVSLNFIIKIR